MKFYELLIFISLIINFCNSTTECGLDDEATGPSDCKNRDIEGTGAKYCCYFEGTDAGNTVKACFPVSESAYKDIKGYIKKFEEQNDEKIQKLDCNSFYLQLGIMSLIFLFL